MTLDVRGSVLGEKTILLWVYSRAIIFTVVTGGGGRYEWEVLQLFLFTADVKNVCGVGSFTCTYPLSEEVRSRQLEEENRTALDVIFDHNCLINAAVNVYQSKLKSIHATNYRIYVSKLKALSSLCNFFHLHQIQIRLSSESLQWL
jgi:hypothetical protein